MRRRYRNINASQAFNNVIMPIEIAMANRDDVVKLLLDMGAECNFATQRSLQAYGNESSAPLDYARWAQKKALHDLTTNDVAEDESTAVGQVRTPWQTYCTKLVNDLVPQPQANPNESEIKRGKEDTASFFADTERLLERHGAKPWNDLFPDKPQTTNVESQFRASDTDGGDEKKDKYHQITTHYSRTFIPRLLNAQYDELFEACYAGDNDKIQELCLPPDGTVSDRTLLSMSVSLVDPNNRHWLTGSCS